MYDTASERLGSEWWVSNEVYGSVARNNIYDAQINLKIWQNTEQLPNTLCK